MGFEHVDRGGLGKVEDYLCNISFKLIKRRRMIKTARRTIRKTKVDVREIGWNGMD
jgi:hypothetical protein